MRLREKIIEQTGISAEEFDRKVDDEVVRKVRRMAKRGTATESQIRRANEVIARRNAEAG